jgi:hypothetical protein
MIGWFVGWLSVFLLVTMMSTEVGHSADVCSVDVCVTNASWMVEGDAPQDELWIYLARNAHVLHVEPLA